MRFDVAARRLAVLPAVLPAGPAVLVPVRLTADGDEVRERIALADLRERPAAVLVLVFPGADGEASVLLTERVDRGGHHSGEVSFPGGSTEPHDDSPAATAIREAAEEVGLDGDAVGLAVVGQLESFWIPVSGFRVTPIVAVADRRPTGLRPAPAEVARIVEAPLSAFLPDAPIEIVEREVRGWPLRYGAYRIDGLSVWGATARILGQLGALVSTAQAGSPSAGS
ncbi:MAG TPA: CoA pyrophosphatase [Candidatus Limnocylindrales bacterium]|nr:CoA pyrophosphatase [Candidatus Limnocylindrales bacterium]